MHETYTKRNELLKKLGYQSYKSYLSSQLWRRIRYRALHRANWLCEICKQATAVQVHHKRYDERTLTGKTLRHLIAVCDECHALGEIGFKGEKLDLPECNIRHKELRNKSHTRHKASRDVCFVCKKNPVSRINGKCTTCRRQA